MTCQYTFDPARGPRAALSIAACALILGAVATAQSREYTTDADFDEGILVDVNHDAPYNDQLQLNTVGAPFPMISVANSGNGTMVRIDAVTGAILGEYRTAPEGEATDPSRATVDEFGNAWLGNRAEDVAGIEGSVVKIGVVIGGTRVDSSGNPDVNGGYLKPPFGYSTAVDRDGDGLIRTSMGLGDVLSWVDVTDGVGGGPGGGSALVEDAEDECILVFQKTVCPNIRHLSLDAANDIWVGGYPGFPTCFQLLDGDDGSYVTDFVSFGFCGGFSGLVDGGGLLWSTSQGEDQLMQYDTSVGIPSCFPVMNDPRGVAVDSAGFLWVAGSGEVYQMDTAGTVANMYTVPGASFLHGIVVHPADDSVWVADASTDTVYRLSSSGSLMTTILVGVQPNGLAIDANGMVWVCDQGTDDLRRIDPATDTVDLLVDLGVGAQPFNISDMTGVVDYQATVPQGSWEVITDGGEDGASWLNVSWNGSTPDGSLLTVLVRAADDQADLPGLPWVPVTSGTGISQTGRYLQTGVVFDKSAYSNASPILLDLTVEWETNGGGDDCLQLNRRKPGSLLLYPEYDNRQGLISIFSVTHVDCDAEDDLTIEFKYINQEDCREFNRTVVLTPCDTLTLLTAAHNPESDRGYAYVFIKDPRTGEPLAENVLVGNLMIINGLDTFEYGMNPVVFEGLGVDGKTDLDGDGVLDLDGLEYAQAPAAILVPRFLGQRDGDGGQIRSELILIGLTGGVHFETTVDFLIYNDNEEVFSGEHTFYCWEKVELLDISGIFDDQFLKMYTDHDPAEILGAEGREAGWFQIDGAWATSAVLSIPDPAFYAVLVEHVGNFGVADLPFEYCTQDNGELLPDDLGGGGR